MLRRNGTYYFRKRIPKDVIDLAPFGKDRNGKPKADHKFSLKTKDPQVAKRLAANEIQKFEERIAEARGNPPLSNTLRPPSKPTLPIKRREKPPGLQPLGNFDHKSYIDRLFIELEERAVQNGSRGPFSLSSQDREELLRTYETDLRITEGLASEYEPPDWKARCYWAIIDQGYDPDSNPSSFQAVCKLFKEAHIESLWRTVQALKGDDCAERNSRFAGTSFDSGKSLTPHGTGHTLKELCETFVEHRKAKKVAAKTLQSYKSRIQFLLEFFGPHTHLSEINLEKAESFVDAIGQIPLQCSTRYRGKTFTQAIKIEEKKNHPKTLAPKTQRDWLSAISAIFRHAEDRDWLTKNPFSSRLVRERVSQEEGAKREMFTIEELNRFFRLPAYLKQKDVKPYSAKYWGPLLGLYHGFRINEFCQLLLEDIKIEDGIDFISIRTRDDAGEVVKTLKNNSSVRRVPIHPQLIKLGFLDHVSSLRKSGKSFLFPELKATKTGSKGGAVGSWFGRHRLKALDTPPARKGDKSFHTLRHSFRQACWDNQISNEYCRALGGWSDQNKSSDSNYGSGYKIKTLQEQIEKISYPELDLSHLISNGTTK
ncbi:MAG: site-specific integrase [Akkermansiaceae bacterium]